MKLKPLLLPSTLKESFLKVVDGKSLKTTISIKLHLAETSQELLFNNQCIITNKQENNIRNLNLSTLESHYTESQVTQLHKQLKENWKKLLQLSTKPQKKVRRMKDNKMSKNIRPRSDRLIHHKRNQRLQKLPSLFFQGHLQFLQWNRNQIQLHLKKLSSKSFQKQKS